MEEYKIITEDAITCQKLLNQWKHEFTLKILAMSVHEGKTIILLTRTKK